MTGRRQHVVVTLDLHVLDIRTQRRPQPMHNGNSVGVGFRQRGQNDLVTPEQRSVGSFDAALLGPGNRMPRHKA
ncbi:DNA-binding transcriptional regulator [Pseudomonas syringae pv. actinidiae]|uniref:DNA-binding transcriptional regulator n=1 Tax=Pseudomonas syringae pv. actinidiae TaxID=103796 RepID=A0A2V0QFQ9_PSESF|nr:DNA-binding transcriptional regulator [Pseudomonas syringae pv. actinidiae]